MDKERRAKLARELLRAILRHPQATVVIEGDKMKVVMS
jgi:hypothetical protein